MFPGTLYETHVKTKSLERAISFYKKLGMDLVHIIEERKVAFFWFDKNHKKEQMLGVWRCRMRSSIRATLRLESTMKIC